MPLKIVPYTLSADLVGGGSFTIGYPAGTTKGNFSGSLKHKLATKTGNIFGSPAYFTLTFGTSSITVNWTSGSPTLAASTEVLVQLDEPGYSASQNKSPFPELFGVVRGGLIHVNFGSPAVGDVDGICVAQAMAAAGVANINGALAVGGVAHMDVPRNLVVDSSSASDTAVNVTITGKDVYGKAMKETIALNGTTDVVGVKAFKSVSKVETDAVMVGNLIVGTSNKLGLPVFLPSSAYVLKEIYDAGAVTNGTLTAGSTAKPTAATGDVRGLYAPNTAPDSAHTYELVLALADPDFLGQEQFAG